MVEKGKRQTSIMNEEQHIADNGEQKAPVSGTPANGVQSNEVKEKKKKPNWTSRIVGGDVFTSSSVQRQIPLIALLCLFGIALVWNRYTIEDLSRQKQRKQDEILFLRQKRIELQKRYQETIKISQIAERLDSTGVGITAGPPYELRIEN